MTHRVLPVAWGVILSLAAGGLSAAFAQEAPTAAAAQADQLLSAEVGFSSAGAQPAPLAGDEVFLRRLTLDLHGRQPTIAETIAFALDGSPNKRVKKVEELLADSRYGANWARYWRDVVMYRATEQRAQIVAGSMEQYFRDAFNQNKPWSEIATAFVTAKGDALENGQTGLIIAQEGKPEETVSEISRIFLGVQIQCAQCHDHPTDRWKREQFHQLAAFFPRVSARLILTPDRREISVAVAEFGNTPISINGNRVRGTSEHYMPDLKNPNDRGTLMQPVFFATGDKLPSGTRDAERRGQLASWITKADNPFFAKAIVNRLWSELVGEGFYEPVDDIGPDRECSAPQTLDYLAQQFTQHNHDLKWLFQTITGTQAYQRESRPRRTPDEKPFLANVPRRLRSDELFDNLLAALDLAEPSGAFGGGAGAGQRLNRGPRQQFAQVFGYDPSERRDEVAGAIPQALMMMNSTFFAGAVSGSRSSSGLGRLMREISDDRALVVELYLKTLAREPTANETATCLAHIKEIGGRTEAFEDLLWTLVNSTEFLHRR